MTINQIPNYQVAIKKLFKKIFGIIPTDQQVVDFLNAQEVLELAFIDANWDDGKIPDSENNKDQYWRN